nr:uncharacterized protein LOC109166971 [Ipomoea trifida]
MIRGHSNYQFDDCTVGSPELEPTKKIQKKNEMKKTISYLSVWTRDRPVLKLGEIATWLHLAVGVSMEYKKEKEKRAERRSSHRLAEQARQGMLKARKAAHGGHEVGDTSTDPLVLTSEDEEMETPPPAMEQVLENRDYHQNDDDYVLFLLKQSENEGPRNNSSPNSSAPTQESSYSPSGYAPTPPRAKSKASKGIASSSRKK